jgi:hypothetical protein
MATNIDFMFPAAAYDSATALDAEEESLQATWVETAVTVILTAIAVIIVSSISIVMAMA